MRTMWNGLLASVIVMSSAVASAQISNVGTETQGTVNILGGPSGNIVINGPSADYRSDSLGTGGGYAAFADINGDNIFFEAGSMSAGQGNGSRSVTEVSFDVTGTVPGGRIDRIVSTVFESTFGFYLGNFDTGCSGATLPSCARTTVEDGFDSFGRFGAVDGIGEIARTGFAFEILYNDAAIRTIAGSISMQRNADGSIAFIEDLGSGDNALSAALIGFGSDDVANYAKVYKWDRTPFEATLEDAIEFGESAKITYRITTETQSWARNFGNNASPNMVVGFACFADPFGKGGGRIEVPGFSAMLDAIGNPADATCDDFVLDGDEEPRVYTLGLPVVREGVIIFAAVPEPASWAMLISGFGLVGASLRRKRALHA